MFETQQTVRVNGYQSRGFSLIEILIVILIIGLLAEYFGQNAFRQTDDAKLAVAELQLTQRIPSAIISLTTSRNVFAKAGSSAVITQELVKRGVKPETPWGKPCKFWADNDNNNDDAGAIYVNYQFPSAKMTEVVAQKLKDDSAYPMLLPNLMFTRDGTTLHVAYMPASSKGINRSHHY